MAKKIITILIPSCNEGKVIADVIDACWIGLDHDKRHQILFSDCSTDNSAEIAKKMGAEVVKTPRRGLGRAYIDAIPHIKGDYVIVGDADATYDYTEVGSFVKKLDDGYDFVMGTRMKGWIEKDAMPKLHQYFGIPFTNWIFNVIYRSKISDIHCGMRGMTKKALVEMNMQSQGWEYASEMIIKAFHMNLKITEVPIHFYKDKKGRQSHHKRSGWFSPWLAGWINLKAMFIYGSDFFLIRPGVFFATIGLATVGALSLGPIGKLSLYSMLLGMTFAVLGMISVSMGIIASILYDFTDLRISKWLRIFEYNRSSLISAVLTILGICLTLPLIIDYVSNDYRLDIGVSSIHYSSVTGLLFILIGFYNFIFTLLLNALRLRLERDK